MARSEGPNLTYRIVEALGVAIVSGKYSPKNPFPIEADLCTQYGASRSVLREAVKMLTAKGLLSARPRQGTWIQPEENRNLLDPDVLRWLLERKITFSVLREFALVRLAVEQKAAALVARVASPDAKQAIRTAIEQMDLADKDEVDPLVSDPYSAGSLLLTARPPGRSGRSAWAWAVVIRSSASSIIRRMAAVAASASPITMASATFL